MNLIRGVPPREAREGELVALDIEMYGQTEPLHLPTGRLACLSVAMGDDVWQVYDLQRFRETIKRMRKGMWCLHNAIYDIRQMKRYADIPIVSLWDTYLVERHLYAGYFTTTYGLIDLARRYLNIQMDKEVRNLFSEASEMTPEMEQYAATDAWVTLRIAEKQMEQKRLGIDFRSYDLVNAPAIWAIEAMDPVRVDPDGWMALAQRLGDEGRELQATLPCNVNSPAQVKAFVQSILGREIKKTDRETLELLAGDANDDTDGGRVELKHIMRARTLLKMESTYGASFLKTLQPGGLLLPGWKVDGADTGRMACGEPNFHNVPVRDLPDFRYAVLAREGNQFIVSDASQQEPRVGAVLTQDPELMRLVKTGESIYIMVASEMMGLKITKKDPRYDPIKTVVLGTFYGLTPTGLAKRERIPRRDAQKLQDTFFKTFKDVPKWMQKERQLAYSRNYVETLLGRRLWVNIYNDQWENNAVNNPIQGTAAEITKLALVYMWEESRARGWPYCIVLQIHDELNADCPTSLVSEYKTMMDDCWKEAGRKVIPDVPFVTEFAVGDNWGCKR
jgi:DNA polymerase-1